MITDKELLTFCNLANLEMEYANLIKKEKKKDENGNSLDEKIETNHTIYTIFAKQKSTLFQVCPFLYVKKCIYSFIIRFFSYV